MALFVSAVDEGSLAAAARRHGQWPAAVTGAVSLLERQAGDILLLRSTRRLSLTPSGQRYVSVWSDVLARLREIEPDPAARTLKGQIVLTARKLFGRMKVVPILGEFLREHPHIEARMLMANHLFDLTGEEVDLAVRLAPLSDSTFKTVQVGEVQVLLCASPDYLANAGAPSTPANLDRHDCISPGHRHRPGCSARCPQKQRRQSLCWKQPVRRRQGGCRPRA
ncbi:LysR substrate-binding domain-containing protein [Roseomonas cutis]|uniref:LysR substrate-binding domain-containing protein n=1 Tax=Roseomonas cutis TaxID=2897332 RepID=UPI00351CE38F